MIKIGFMNIIKKTIGDNKKPKNDLLDSPPVPPSSQGSSLLDQDITKINQETTNTDNQNTSPDIVSQEQEHNDFSAGIDIPNLSKNALSSNDQQSISSNTNELEIPAPPPNTESLTTDSYEIPSAPSATETSKALPHEQTITSSEINYEIEDSLIKQEKENIIERRTHKSYDKPIFVEVNDYKQILDYINEIKNNIKKSDNILTTLQDIKSAKEKEFEKWHNVLEDIQRKLIYIDNTLFEQD